ncbi:DUF4292 domain-containing protein [Winogradskyella sediminis]|uniref:Deoxyuridine 5'-triphosphate nucleotidohydrolase n=1 Tax=Winogradskyella sediminis TaxID=1382466 RepID=A0A1H1SAW7_9FLAO|nr:DUF4292 domain-containing protein [Winogradskyella sediminis]REG89281.1 uncharacterized protein DUF4292 [Winogradskyella sediminis]SDS45127.1 protein of unknown function [Winogradskyella sediminis]
MKSFPTYKIFKNTLGVLLIAVAFSCSSAKRVIASGEASEQLSVKQVIKQHQKNETDFKTLKARLKIDITQNNRSQGAGFTLRIEKDKVIWLSESILGMARMMITPDKVRFYNKIDNEYFDGDYKLLSDVAGIDLDFMKVQNILLGQTIHSLNDKPYQVSVNNNSYAVSPKEQNALLELFYLINPSHFKMDSLQLQQVLKRRLLQVDYAAYQEVDKQIIPKNISIVAVEDTDEVGISMEFKSVSLNDEVRFPFNIPSGYKEMVIK